MQHLIQCLNRHDIEQTDELLADIRRAVIKDMFERKTDSPVPNTILNAVSEITGIEKLELIGGRAFRHITKARILFSYCATNLGFSLREIGENIGNRHHSTITYHNKEAKDLIDTDEDFRWQVKQVMSLLSPTQS